MLHSTNHLNRRDAHRSAADGQLRIAEAGVEPNRSRNDDWTGAHRQQHADLYTRLVDRYSASRRGVR
jgi:hypothetical protein